MIMSDAGQEADDRMRTYRGGTFDGMDTALAVAIGVEGDCAMVGTDEFALD